MVLISKITADQQVSIPSVVSNLELRWFCYMIGLEKSRHPLNQSNSKQKPTAFGRLQFPAHFYFEFSLARCDIFLSCDWPLWLLWFLWHSSGRRSNWLHLDFLLVAVTEWLKEQSPLTENELEKLRINMDDFKVLDMFSRASSSSFFFSLSFHWQMIVLTFVLIDRWNFVGFGFSTFVENQNQRFSNIFRTWMTVDIRELPFEKWLWERSSQ